MNDQSSTDYNYQKLETTQMSLGGWINKWTVAHPYNGIPRNNKKEKVTDICNNLDEQH